MSSTRQIFRQCECTAAADICSVGQDDGCVCGIEIAVKVHIHVSFLLCGQTAFIACTDCGSGNEYHCSVGSVALAVTVSIAERIGGSLNYIDLEGTCSSDILVHIRIETVINDQNFLLAQYFRIIALDCECFRMILRIDGKIFCLCDSAVRMDCSYADTVQIQLLAQCIFQFLHSVH